MPGPDDRVRQQLEAWRKDLINLTRTNRLLYLRLGHGLQIDWPAPQGIFEQLSKGLEVYLPPEDGDDDPPPPREGQVRLVGPDRSKLVSKLRSLDRNATQTFMDRGIWVLYIAFGQLEWEESRGSDGTRQLVRSPLLLVPAQLKRASASEPYRLVRAEEEQRFNPALAAKLAADFELVFDLPEDDDELDPGVVLASIGAQVKGRGWRVLPTVLLSTFSFQKEPILRDLQANEAKVAAHALVRGLALGSEAEESFEFEPISEDGVDELAPPEQMVTIRDADASQRRAIASAVAGKSFVMDGPPGTGKSQTIANMIADLLAKQKKVLFVSDKVAALEVVYNRLQESGLHEFVLEVHSHKTTRKEVARALGRAIQTRVNGSASLSVTERERLRRRRVELSEYVEAVNAPRPPLNQSLHQVIGRIAGVQGLPQAPQAEVTFECLDSGLLSTIIDAGEALARAWGPVERADAFLWQDLAPGGWSQGRRVELLALLDATVATLGVLCDIADAVAEDLAMYPPAALSEVQVLQRVESHLHQRPQIEPGWLSVESLDGHFARLESARIISKGITELEAVLKDLVGANWAALPSAGPKVLAEAIRDLEEESEAPDEVREADSARLLREAGLLRHYAELLSRLDPNAQQVAALLEVPAASISPHRFRELAGLVGLAGSPDLPDAEWYRPSGRAGARSATTELRPLAEALNAAAEGLREVFTVDVIELDLETLCVRFEGVYRGWFAWLGRDYRRDKRLLKQVTRSGQLRKAEIGRLREALQWQEAARAFAAAASECGPALGSYFSGAETDFERVDRALDVYDAIVLVAGKQVAWQSLQRNFARGTTLSVECAAAAEEVKACCELIQACGPIVDRYAMLPIHEAHPGAETRARAMDRVREQLHIVGQATGREAKASEAVKWLELRSDAHLHRSAFESEQAADLGRFGESWRFDAYPWKELEEALKWSAQLRSLLDGPLEAGMASTMAKVDVSQLRLPEAFKQWESMRELVLALFREPYAKTLRAQLQGGLSAARSLLEQLASSIDDIPEWIAHEQARTILRRNGMEAPLGFCLKSRVKAEHVRSVLERAALEAWVDHILASDPRVKDLRAADRDALVAEFKRLDKKLIQLAAFETIAVCNDIRPKNIYGQAGIVLREAEKQRRHMPVRKLLAEAREVVQAVKPCFMMSPLSVSQFLPPDITFDVVIFDEASQVKPADAISGIYRAAQLVVAGDQKQLPPTAFFERMEGGDDDSYDEEEPESFESVLDLCKGSGLFTSVPLRWHYRSQHEHLITYSNYSFYDGSLLTFPGAVQEAGDLGIEVFRVPGIYRRGGQRDNPIEAAKVGERVLHHAQNHPQRTLGVVAFSEAQASAIDAVLDKLADAHPEIRRIRDEDRLNGLFVKNLETVQGDERDIIIFSMGYGKDENGKFTMNFGPLTKAGGERRLNVAITRARRRVEFVTSVSVEDFTSDLTSAGGRHLRRYLDFASRKDDRLEVLAIPVIQGGGDFESPFEVEVARVVRAWGHEIVPQVGCAGYRVDLGVRDPINAMRFVLGIECDGAMYHSSKVARDRDRLRQEVLEGLGWKLHRIWGPAWYRNRREEEERLRLAIDEAITAKRSAATDGGGKTRKGAVEIEVVDAELGDLPEWVGYYEVATIYPAPPGLQIEAVSGKQEIQRIAHTVIETEGPVHEKRVLKAVRDAFGVGRAGSRIQACFESALRSAKAKDPALYWRNGFLWREGSELAVRIPDADDPRTVRVVDEVPPQELELALRLAVRDAKSIQESALITYVARLFGWDRSGSQITGTLASCIRRLTKRQVLVAKDGILRQGAP